MNTIKHLIKKVIRFYFDGYSKMYMPMIKAGCTPFV